MFRGRKLHFLFSALIGVIVFAQLSRVKERYKSLPNLTHVELLNKGTWHAHGGLPICPETHAFFLQAAQAKRNICEIGMGSGAAAFLFLQSSTATVYEFDLGAEVKHNVATYLRDNFDGRFIPHWGDFRLEIPKFPKTCDLIYVDALHPEDVKLAMQYLGGESAQWIYHSGGAGDLSARDYILRTYGEHWEETNTSNTSRADGKRCVYYTGKLRLGN